MSGGWNPLRPFKFWRRLWSEWLTPSSKLSLLAIIASLNAVWGYPLVGLLASLLTLLVVGAFANWLFRPRLSAVMRMPELVAANSIIDARISMENKASTPVFDLAFSLTALPSGWIARSEPPSISQMNPREACDLGYTLQVAGRGEYRWPTLRCESTFPFSLFRAWQDIPFGLSSTTRGARTWVTPAIIDSDLPGLIQAMLSRGQQSDGMRAGESLEYLGSREYTYGDFVRRWDFASWARLGRPIVRLFDQSSTGNLTIVVDTFLGSQTPANGDVSFETRLSLAASIIQSLRFTSCHIDLIFPKSEGIELVQADPSMQETLLRPLATVIGLHRDRNSTGLTSQKNGWEIVRSMLEPDNTLICIMGPTDTLQSSRQTMPLDHERREFLELVAGFPTSIIVAGEGQRQYKGIA